MHSALNNAEQCGIAIENARLLAAERKRADELDALREAHTLAVVPAGSGATPERVRAIDGCLGVRGRTDGLHAVFGLPPDEACGRIERELRVTAGCRSIALEDMFIELAGGQG